MKFSNTIQLKTNIGQIIYFRHNQEKWHKYIVHHNLAKHGKVRSLQSTASLASLGTRQKQRGVIIRQACNQSLNIILSFAHITFNIILFLYSRRAKRQGYNNHKTLYLSIFSLKTSKKNMINFVYEFCFIIFRVIIHTEMLPRNA